MRNIASNENQRKREMYGAVILRFPDKFSKISELIRAEHDERMAEYSAWCRANPAKPDLSIEAWESVWLNEPDIEPRLSSAGAASASDYYTPTPKRNGRWTEGPHPAFNLPNQADLRWKNKKDEKWYEPSSIYPYYYIGDDDKLKIHCLAARYELEDGGKEIIPWYWTKRSWIPKRHPNPIIYRLNEVFAHKDATIIHVEGEKDADGGRAMFAEDDSLVFTTSLGGAMYNKSYRAWEGHDYTPYRGRHVVIIPDPDKPGAIYREGVAKLIQAAGAASVRVGTIPAAWQVPDKKNGGTKAWGFGDPLPEGASLADVRAIIENAVLWVPSSPDEPKTKFKFVDVFDIQPNLNNLWLIKQLLPANGLALFYGPPGCGKSFNALHVGSHIAAGLPYAGHRVRKGFVVYVACEGEKGFSNRVVAARNAIDLPKDAKLKIIPVTPNLGREDGDAEQLINEIRAQIPDDEVPAVIFIDTVSRTLGSANENQEGMAAFIMNAGLIQQAFSGLVVGVHHTGWSDAERPRGWSGIDGACDAEWRFAENNIFIRKIKDGQQNWSWGFELPQVKLGEDEDGDPVTTCTVNLTSKPEIKTQDGAAKTEKKNCKYRLQFEQAFQKAILDNPVERYLTTQAGVKAPKMKCARVSEVKADFYKLCVGIAANTRAQAWKSTLAQLFKEYPQETDTNGEEWIWKNG